MLLLLVFFFLKKLILIFDVAIGTAMRSDLTIPLKFILKAFLASVQRIKEIVENEKRRDHSDYDAFILFILSHGENGCVLGEDEEPISVDMIVSTIGGCDTLRDKPKMFFFHTCRCMFFAFFVSNYSIESYRSQQSSCSTVSLVLCRNDSRMPSVSAF